jgi:hypothetical protein
MGRDAVGSRILLLSPPTPPPFSSFSRQTYCFDRYSPHSSSFSPAAASICFFDRDSHHSSHQRQPLDGESQHPLPGRRDGLVRLAVGLEVVRVDRLLLACTSATSTASAPWDED